MTRIYLGIDGGIDKQDIEHLVADGMPLLSSFALAYHRWIWTRPTLGPVMLDSGAFSAFASGKTIAKEALLTEAMSGRYSETAALDVIGNHEHSRANWLWSLSHGCDAWPTFHIGEPWDLLTEYCSKSWKVGLGGIARLQGARKDWWLSEVFRRAWPHRFHGFGITKRAILERFPFHSTDSTSWAFGNYMTGKITLPGKGRMVKVSISNSRSKSNIYLIRRSTRFSYHFFRVLAQEMRSRWRAALAEAERAAPPRPTIQKTHA